VKYEALPIQKHQIKLDVQSTRNMIRADEKLLRNIFVNLMTNAVKFSPQADVVDIRTENSGDTIITSITITVSALIQKTLNIYLPRF
jgi:signal transduction histidine kinase